MADIGGFFWTVLAGGGVSALLLGIAAILGKSQLAHWLNKDIEVIKSQHQKALEADKAKYARELETYRTSLIAQAEAIKASQDVRKAMALQLAGKRFEAIFQVHKCLIGTSVELLALMKHSFLHPQYREDLDRSRSRILSLSSSIDHASLFFGSDERTVLYDLLDQLWVLRRLALEHQETIPEHVLDPHRKKTLALQAAADNVVQVRFKEMLDMQ